jgi:hypothetical protein
MINVPIHELGLSGCCGGGSAIAGRKRGQVIV